MNTKLLMSEGKTMATTPKFLNSMGAKRMMHDHQYCTIDTRLLTQ
jgi:hypothetical protein